MITRIRRWHWPWVRLYYGWRIRIGLWCYDWLCRYHLWRMTRALRGLGHALERELTPAIREAAQAIRAFVERAGPAFVAWRERW